MDRNDWLRKVCERAIETRADIFANTDLDLVTLDTAYTSSGKRSNTYGEAYTIVDQDAIRGQIIVSGVYTDPFEIAVTVVHELLHVECPGDHHGGQFRVKSKALGVSDAAHWKEQSSDFKAWIEDIIADAGPMPGRVALPGQPKRTRVRIPLPPAEVEAPAPEVAVGEFSSAQPKQGSRLLKLECSECGFICRTTAKWVRDDMDCPYPDCSGKLVQEDKTEDTETEENG